MNHYHVFMTRACRQQWQNVLARVEGLGLDPDLATQWLRRFTQRLRGQYPNDNKARIEWCDVYGPAGRIGIGYHAVHADCQVVLFGLHLRGGFR
jgi:hypothetical protein